MSIINKFWPFSRFKRQQNEINRLHGVIVKQLKEDITLKSLRGKGCSVVWTFEGSPLHLFAEAFGEQFYGSGASNFLTMSFEHRDSNELFEVTMQKVSGETLCDQLARLKGENESYKRNQEK